MNRIGRIATRITSALALAAMLVLAVLPAGQLPRIAGPCGKALCECPTVLVRTTCHITGETKFERVAARQVVTFGETAHFGEETPGLELQNVLDSVTTPRAPMCVVSITEEAVVLANHESFALTHSSSDIVVPPPRA